METAVRPNPGHTFWDSLFTMVASSSLWLGVSKSSDSDAVDIPLHRIFMRGHRIKAPDGIADSNDVGGLAL